MNTNLMIFEDKKVEVFELNGQVLFNPKHVGECLNIKDVNSVIRYFNSKKVIKLKNSDMHSIHIRKLNNAGENFLTESGVYNLIFKSRKVEAEKFQDWVTDEVLPTIRKHGAYMSNEVIEQTLSNPDFIIGLATKLKEEKEKNKAQQEYIKKQEPKVVIADRFTSCNGYIEIKSFVKMLDIPKMGRTNFFKWLRGKEILMEDNIPYQRYSDYFKVINMMRKDNRWHKKTVIKYSGIEYIIKKLIKDNYIEKMDYNKILERFDKEIKNNVA